VSSLSLDQAPLQEFEENIQYARLLIAGGVALQGLPDFPAHAEDLYRAAWNQAVSAMDHWLHGELIERALYLINDTGNQRPASMLNLRLPFAMLERTRSEPLHIVFREFLENEFQRRSFHGVQDITDGLKLVTHLDANSVWDSVGRAFGISRDQAKQTHQQIIKRRNEISHRADRDASGGRQLMTETQATAAVDWIDGLVHGLYGLLLWEIP
jgi:restriction system protein